MMCLMNRLMIFIGNLRDEFCSGVLIYKRVYFGSVEKVVWVGMLLLIEVLSGKYFFVV